MILLIVFHVKILIYMHACCRSNEVANVIFRRVLGIASSQKQLTSPGSNMLWLICYAISHFIVSSCLSLTSKSGTSMEDFTIVYAIMIGLIYVHNPALPHHFGLSGLVV